MDDETECFYCHKKGHKKVDCRKRKADLAKDADPSDVRAKTKILTTAAVDILPGTCKIEWIAGRCMHVLANTQARVGARCFMN